jgi:hypothetical protein
VTLLSHKLALVEPKSQCSSANLVKPREKGHCHLTDLSFASSQLVVGHNCCRLRGEKKVSTNNIGDLGPSVFSLGNGVIKGVDIDKTMV